MTTLDTELRQALQQDDHLEARTATRMTACGKRGVVILFDYELRCSSCRKVTRQPRISGGSYFCDHCSPTSEPGWRVPQHP